MGFLNDACCIHKGFFVINICTQEGRPDPMVVGFITTYAISAYHH